ncbi:MAG: hypothetical protein IOB85_01355 [Methylobacterium sp.]|nr:hypothetical protein [Methylobacterium sp.]MCA3654903.1 hypothetical protein [Methylobacterium sp.]MCA3658916.1 hypothetical protein [Methylobacterium sp.]MCA3660372.1 hypothetical protein [Methylobacterium sp.]MCA3663246.1 hypothetical protein [Methylobacterium sp.]
MQNRPLVKIVDHCQRLTRRQHDLDQGRPIIGDEINAAFDEACLSIWQATYDDIDWELITEVEEYNYSNRESVWQKYALSKGYTLESLIPNKLVPEAEYFFFMINAHEYNAFAKTPEQKAKLALQREVAEFLNDKATGVLKGY